MRSRMSRVSISPSAAAWSRPARCRVRRSSVPAGSSRGCSPDAFFDLEGDDRAPRLRGDVHALEAAEGGDALARAVELRGVERIVRRDADLAPHERLGRAFEAHDAHLAHANQLAA